MKNKISVFLLLILVLFLSSCQKEAKSELGNGMLQYRSAGGDYTFEYPEKWEVTRNDGMAAVKADTDNTNISVTCFTLKDDFQSIDEYLNGKDGKDGYKKLFSKTFGEMNIISETDTELSGHKAKRIVYTVSISGDEYKCDTTMFLYTSGITKETFVYSILYTAVPDKFDTHAVTLEKLLQSFQLT